MARSSLRVAGIARSVLLCGSVAGALPGCEWTTGLQSDPAYWDPPRSGASVDGSTSAPHDATTLVDANGSGCVDEPPFDDALRVSNAEASSHLAGRPCIEGCHEPGGTAKKVFAAGGTVYQSQKGRVLALPGGKVQNVGGTTLTVDRCGNVYATADALKAPASSTLPFVQNPTLHRMDKRLVDTKRPGDCNQSGCHDFSGKLKWGIYF